MSEDPHRKAERLMIESRIGPVSGAELSWLDAHLEQCERCAALSRATEGAVCALRSVPVRVSPALVATTQSRVHQRAHELNTRRTTPILAWLGAALSRAWTSLRHWGQTTLIH